MITYFNGTVFNAPAQAIVNTVNCTGVMGAGIALEFALRYPDMYEDYKEKCKNQRIKLGEVDYYKANDIIIINFPTKWHFKYPSKIEWIRAALNDFVLTYKKMGITSVAFPKLGTLNGGLEWREVKILMESFLDKIDIPVYICLDINEAQGLEKRMLEVYNRITIEELKAFVRLTEKQKTILANNRPINRFWKIKELAGIGITTYEKIFFYCKEKAEGKNIEQISIFD